MFTSALSVLPPSGGLCKARFAAARSLPAGDAAREWRGRGVRGVRGVRAVHAAALSSRVSAGTRERAEVLEEGRGKGALSGGPFSSTRVTKPPKRNHTQWAGEAVASHAERLEI